MKSILTLGVLLGCSFSSFAQSGTHLTITAQPQSQTVPLGANVTLSVGVSGPGPFTYQWQFNGTTLPRLGGIITTIAGNGSPSYSGDGALATNATLNGPWGEVVDASGNLFIADQSNHRIRQVNSAGLISTIAGNGTADFSGDGGQATAAALNNPADVAVDLFGNLFIADQYNHRIRRVGANGIITTVAGNGTGAYSGDGGPATNASLFYPSGLTIDSLGNLFIADRYNHCIRKVSVAGVISTVAGNGSGGFSGDGGLATSATLNQPYGVAVDTSGNIYIADWQNHRIRKTSTNGIMTTFAGDGNYGYSGDGSTATSSSLWGPKGVAVDSFGDVLIADQGNSRIRSVGMDGIITTVAGNGGYNYTGDGGPATNASLYYPAKVATDFSATLYISDWYNHRIRKVTPPANSNLFIANITAANLGNYDVIVSNPSETVTSSIAVLQIGPGILVNGQAAIGTVQSIGSALITMSGTLVDGFIFYTLDGTTPTTSSLLYTGPITITNTTTVNAMNLSSDFSQELFANQVIVQIIPTYNCQTSVVGAGTISTDPPGGTYASGTAVTLTASAAANWAFDHWTGDASGNLNPLSVTMNGPRNIQAVFVQTGYPLTVTTPGGGSATVNGLVVPPETFYNIGATVTLSAVASSGWSFLGWQGDASATDNPLNVTINRTNNIQAIFGTVVSVNPVGGGNIVLSQPNPIPFGTALTASAIPNAGNYFVTWSGAASGTNSPTTFNVINPTPAVDALFAIAPGGKCTLSVVVNGSGRVTINPAQNYYNPGDSVTLTAATTNAGFAFHGWLQGGTVITNNPLIVVMATNTVIQANFQPLPSVSISPPNLILLAGNNGTLTANTTEQPPVTYQWQNSGGLISGATSSTYAIMNAQAINSDNYSVIVSNLFGAVTSAVATVTVVFPPSILVPPMSQTVAAGTPVSLSVSASGTAPLSYQWWQSSGAIAGATASVYSLNPATTNDWDNYAVVVSNGYGTATSSVATLVVYGPVNISGQPTSQVVPAYGTAIFGVNASSYPAPAYQWMFNGGNLSGATSSTLIISNVLLPNLGNYAVRVSNAYSAQTSIAAMLNMSPSIITPFVGATVIWDRSATLSVGAIGSGSLAYQWFLNGMPIANATNAIYNLPNVQFTNGGLYSVVVTSAFGSVTNPPALVVVNPVGVSLGLYAGITITGVVGNTYLIQYTTDLTMTNSWVTLTNLTLQQPVEVWVDTSTNAQANPRRYYQILPGQ